MEPGRLLHGMARVLVECVYGGCRDVQHTCARYPMMHPARACTVTRRPRSVAVVLMARVPVLAYCVDQRGDEPFVRDIQEMYHLGGTSWAFNNAMHVV